VQGVSAWFKAGIPKKKLVVGVPFYGTVLKTSKVVSASTGPYVLLASDSAVQGDKYDEKSADACPGAIASYSGSYQWRSIVSNGIENQSSGWNTYWDTHANTPYAYHKTNKQYLSFDNVKSLKDKVDYVNSESLGGVMVWSLEMDDDASSLLTSLQDVRN
jgi:chitinase